jgi:hypothetical protein
MLLVEARGPVSPLLAGAWFLLKLFLLLFKARLLPVSSPLVWFILLTALDTSFANPDKEVKEAVNSILIIGLD